jgi:hypothetical protein
VSGKVPEVMIDGVRYVPVSDAHVAVAAIEDAIVGGWGGDNWRTSVPDALGFLRVIVTDGTGEGETVAEFTARLLEAASRVAERSPGDE